MSALARVVRVALAVSAAPGVLFALPPAEPPWYLEAVRAPSGLVPPPRPRPVVVAIVDDGVRVSHEALSGVDLDEPAGNAREPRRR